MHTYIGELLVTLIAPDGSSYLLHNRAGGSTDNIDQTYTTNLSTDPANGTWEGCASRTPQPPTSAASTPGLSRSSCSPSVRQRPRPRPTAPGSCASRTPQPPTSAASTPGLSRSSCSPSVRQRPRPRPAGARNVRRELDPDGARLLSRTNLTSRGATCNISPSNDANRDTIASVESLSIAVARSVPAAAQECRGCGQTDCSTAEEFACGQRVFRRRSKRALLWISALFDGRRTWVARQHRSRATSGRTTHQALREAMAATTTRSL